MTDTLPQESKASKPQDEISNEDERGMQEPKEGPDPNRSTSSPGDEEPSISEKMTEPDVQRYEAMHLPLEHEGFDHHAAEAERQAELDAAREEHNRRTGDASRS